jgi:hypothetical protein
MVSHMAELTIILGVPASGKTAPARRLAAQAPCRPSRSVGAAIESAAALPPASSTFRVSAACIRELAHRRADPALKSEAL